MRCFLPARWANEPRRRPTARDQPRRGGRDRLPVADGQDRHPAHASAFDGDGPLAGGCDVSVIALWLGHESNDVTQIYLHADMSIKERVLARLPLPARGTAGRYKPPDNLLAFLEGL
jgi:integrase